MPTHRTTRGCCELATENSVSCMCVRSAQEPGAGRPGPESPPPSIMAPSAHRPGFWGRPTSTLDWCEENYVVSYYIAEFCESRAPPRCCSGVQCVWTARGMRVRLDGAAKVAAAATLASLTPPLLHWCTSNISALMTSPQTRLALFFM